MGAVDSVFNDAFFDTNDFAVEADPSWLASNINVIFFEHGNTIQTEAGAIETTEPVAIIKAADAGGDQEGDTITINGTAYNIIRVLPDGAGVIVLFLSED